MYPFTTEYNALYRQNGMVIRHAAVAGGAQREGRFRDTLLTETSTQNLSLASIWK